MLPGVSLLDDVFRRKSIQRRRSGSVGRNLTDLWFEHGGVNRPKPERSRSTTREAHTHVWVSYHQLQRCSGFGAGPTFHFFIVTSPYFCALLLSYLRSFARWQTLIPDFDRHRHTNDASPRIALVSVEPLFIARRRTVNTLTNVVLAKRVAITIVSMPWLTALAFQ